MNLATIIDGHPAPATALIDPTTTRSYGELRSRVGRLRSGLVSRGVQVGDRVGLVGENSVELFEAYLAVLGVGAIAVPLNRNNPAAATEAELAAVGATLVVVGRGGAASSAVPSVAIDDVLSADEAPVVNRDDDDTAALLFTSGTAGKPKAAILTHGNLRSNLEQARAVDNSVRPDDVMLAALPLDHIYGLNAIVGVALLVGASAVLVPRFDAAGTLALIRDAGITVVPGVPTMFQAWANVPGVDRSSFATVRLALSGAARLPETLTRTYEERFGVTLRDCYGLTEASPAVTTSVGFEPKIGSIGQVMPGMAVRLVDDDGSDSLSGDAGEIWVRGPNVFAGYWNEPEATARALTDDGWLRTGDVAVVDDEGYFFLVDRAKDLIIVSGFNVYPAEVEEVLATHPSVADVAVVGAPHPTTGETVKAFVVPRNGITIDAAALLDHCRDSLARYKCPTEFVVVDDVPRGPNGKVLRRLLAQDA
jgi:long-chain acyl-CoA synthetase